MFLNLLERIDAQFSNALPFVVYRKPNNDKVIAIFQKDTELHYVEDFTETGFVFAPFDSDNPIILLQPDIEHRAAYLPEKYSCIGTYELPEADLAQKEFHINLVKRGITEIGMGTFEKVVLSRKFQINFEKTPLELFQELLSKYSTAFCYLWYHPKVGLWLGATPEILLKTNNKWFTTMSLAGTKANTGSADPVWGKKELEEQMLVTKYICNVLADKVSQLKVSKTESVRAGNLWHLRTSVSGLMEEGGLQEIVKALHPTPAVCGIPKTTTKDFILDNENYNREYYTGFLGELNFMEQKDRFSDGHNQENKAYEKPERKTQLFVNLRCMQLQDNKATIYVGGGVTKGSKPEKEWEETIDKSVTMLSILSNSI